LDELNLPEEELEVIKEIKNTLKDDNLWTEQWTDVRIYRFAKARKFVFEDSMVMIRNDIKWRKESGADNIMETFSKSKYYEVLTKYWPGKWHGLDKRQCPIWFERIASVDVKRIIKVPLNELINFHIWLMERGESIKVGNSSIKGTILCQDLEGLGMKHINSTGFSILQQTIAIDEAHYPESLYRMYLINTPSVFSIVYKIMKAFVDPMTLEKIVICKNKQEFLETATNEIDIESIPEYLGGSCKCTERPCMPNGGHFEFDEK